MMGMAAFSSYEQYKNTDSEWLDEIPIHWEEKRLKHLGSLYAGLGGKSGDDFSKHFVEGFSPFVPFVSIANYERVPSGYQFVKVQASESQNLVKQGDILFLMSSETFEDIAKAALFDQPDQDVFLNSFCKGFRPNVERLHSGFANYLLMAQCYRDYFSSSARGFTRINLKQEYINNTPAILPPLPEQRAIAAFLYDKCAKIDGAVKIKEDQIALLRERRQIIIQDAVTRGLNPAAPMKDSGIDWIGQIPAHWEVKPLMGISDIIDPNPSHRNPEYVEEGFPFISTQEFYGVDEIEIDTPRRVSEKTVIEQEARCHFQNGSLVFSRKGTIGAVRVLPAGIRLGILDSLCVINPKGMVLPNFLFWTLTANYLEAQYGTVLRGAALPQLSVGRVRSLKVILPPEVEQREIADFLREECERLNEGIAIKERQIAALKEYKTSLINAAVTGKIKVI